MTSRRQIIRGAASLIAAPIIAPGRVFAQQKRAVKLLTHANALHIHVPGNAAIHELLPQMGDYAVDLRRLEKLQAITQTLVAGGIDLVDTDTTTVIAAVAAGADLKIVGQFYANVDLAFAVNADKVKSLKDLERDDILVGINATGDVVHALLMGIALKHGINTSKVKVLGLGGSSSRMRALLAGRVQCVPIHLDQAADLARQGNFTVLIKPWLEYKFWSNEVWAARADWLKSPANQRLAVDVLKAQLKANAAANGEFGWYAERYRKFSTVKDAAKSPDGPIREKWELLRNEVKAWPAPMPLAKEDFNSLVPIYEKAGILTGGKVTFDRIVDDSYLKQAQKELGI